MNRFYIEILPQSTQGKIAKETQSFASFTQNEDNKEKSLRALRLKYSIEFVILVSKTYHHEKNYSYTTASS
jgi:hypothetical protein